MAKALPIAPAERQTLRIGDLAKRTNRSARAVRLYEEMGLLGPVFRTDGGHRLYDEDVLTRMSWIDKLQGLSFSLTQIRDLLHDWSDNKFGPSAMSLVREVFTRKLEDTEHQIRQLEALRGELRQSLDYLDSCEVCHPSTVLGECCGCSQPHSVQAEPTLVAGFHVSGMNEERDV